MDVRTVAGRLGHGGGGATTLRVYTAWVAEADQRAAGDLVGRLPVPPSAPGATVPAGVVAAPEEPTSPYQHIAADLRGAITCGALRPGDSLPTVVEIAERYGVAVGTAHRAFAELKASGLIAVSRGRRAVVSSYPEPAVAVGRVQ